MENLEKIRVYFLNVALRPEERRRHNLVEEGRQVPSRQRGLHKRPFARGSIFVGIERMPFWLTE